MTQNTNYFGMERAAMDGKLITHMNMDQARNGPYINVRHERGAYL